MAGTYVIFDRDGTLIKHIEYLIDPGKVELLLGVTEGLKLLSECGFKFGIITNQSVIGRGRALETDVDSVNTKVIELLAGNSFDFRFVLVCPHSPLDNCNCRKPAPGLGLIAIEQYGLNPLDSYMVGDKESDVLFGNSIGCKSILLASSNNIDSKASFIAEGFQSAAQFIANDSKKRKINE